MFNCLTFLIDKFSILCNIKTIEVKWNSDERKERVHVCSPSLRRGDLLEVARTLFTHYGIYLGDDKVAHLIPDILPVLTNDKKWINTVITNKRLILGCLYRCATVRVDTVEDFAYGSNIKVNQTDQLMKMQALSNEDVAKRAEKLKGPIPYSILWNNCEHFATYCRYGSAASQQTEKFFQCLKSIIQDQQSVIITVLIGTVIYLIVYFGMVPSTTHSTHPLHLWMAG